MPSIPPGGLHQPVPVPVPATPPFLTGAPDLALPSAPASVQRQASPATRSDRPLPPPSVVTGTAASSRAVSVQRAAAAPQAAQPVPLRSKSASTARHTIPLPVAPLNLPTVQRDAVTASPPPVLAPHSVKKVPVTGSAPTHPEAPLTKSETPPPPPPPPSTPPPDDPPPSYSASASAVGEEDEPPGYTAIEEGGFDPRALTEYQVDALVHRIIDRITRHVRTELRRDRERVGKLRDFRP
ncbi:hypothetical protein [Streptomyces sp. Ag109_O5-1]|uniref:hypothetical protein n=1 Tax=Streptomyces sp. Ag109_O5-1 TaxID=1938851 RepID=UPI000F4EB867|nr:hypothetical protein [Streptomyces sp. Ag109_O5-1]